MGKLQYSEKYEDLWNEVRVSATIECSGCGKTDTIFDEDDWHASEVFFKRGWRYACRKEDIPECHCPDCVTKNKK